MESLAAGGVYNPDNIWKKPIEQAFDDLMNKDVYKRQRRTTKAMP